VTALILVSIVLLVLLRLLGHRPERDSCSHSLRVGGQVGAVIALALGFAFLISSMASAAPSGAALKFDSLRPSVARDQKAKSGVLLEGTLSQCTIRPSSATGFISSSLSFFRKYEYDGSVRSDARPVVTADYAVTLGVRGRALRSGHHRYDALVLLRVSQIGIATKASPCHSFRYDTTVLMADGTRKRISEVEIGDHVLTTDPETGERVVREVTELHVNRDSDMANVSVRDENGKFSVIYTTQTHRFWSQTDNTWIDAEDLDSGDLLRAFDGSKITVVGVRTWAGLLTMYDLTIEGVHTYYVTTGNEEVLVHNCDFLSKPSQIAAHFNTTTRKVKDAIHAAKRNLPRGGPIRNPDVVVDPASGEKYPNLPTGLGDSIGNIFDYLD
jgi:Pretoxin HINT domain